MSCCALVKTNKSIDVTCRMLDDSRGPITVSTLREAEYFAAHGVTDILYAVGITPNKLPHVLDLRARRRSLDHSRQRRRRRSGLRDPLGRRSRQVHARRAARNRYRRQREKGWTIVDAGRMAMSRDRGTAAQAIDRGYGIVCSEDGTSLGDYLMSSANQDGIIAHPSGDAARLLDVPVGRLLRILPNHACATAAQHARYHVLGDGGGIVETWDRFNGW